MRAFSIAFCLNVPSAPASAPISSLRPLPSTVTPTSPSARRIVEAVRRTIEPPIAPEIAMLTRMAMTVAAATGR